MTASIGLGCITQFLAHLGSAWPSDKEEQLFSIQLYME